MDHSVAAGVTEIAPAAPKHFLHWSCFLSR